MATPGDTLLHTHIQTCQSLVEFNKGIDTIAAQSEYGLMPNDEGKLPLDLINSNAQLTSEEKKIVARRLLNIALAAKKTKPLSEPISFDEVIKQYPDSSSRLRLNLQHACQAVNEARKIANVSITHPDLNTLTYNKFISLYKQCDQNRRRIECEAYQLLLKEADITFLRMENNSAYFELAYSDEVQKKFQFISKMSNGLNNCGELAEFVTIFGKQNAWQVACYRYVKPYGDHVFNLFGGASLYPFNCNPEYWPERVAVADAWSGNVFPAKTYLQNLGDHRTFYIEGKIYNLITKFNPSFNKICSLSVLSNSSTKSIQAELPTKFPSLSNILTEAITNASSAQEKFLFACVIKFLAQLALEKGVITEEDIDSWPHPAETLKNYFSSPEHCLHGLIEQNYLNKDYLNKKIQLALDQGTNPNECFINGWTPLMRCVRYGLTDTVNLLLSNKADPNSVLSDGTTALFLACECNDEDILNLLIERCSLEIIPYIASEQELLTRVAECDKTLQVRMEDHIARKIQQGEDPERIPVLPYDIAKIMGHNHLLRKLRVFEHEQKADKSSVVANQATLFTQRPPQIRQSIEHPNSSIGSSLDKASYATSGLAKLQ